MSDRGHALLLVGVQMVLFAALAGALLVLPSGQTGVMRWLGAGLAGLGLLIILVALATYFWVNGSLVNVSPEPDAQAELVVVGIYRYIRHPIYSGVMLAAVGAALAHGHWAALAVALLLCLFFTYKSFFEERWLVRVYSNYHAYRQRAGRFLPKLIR